MLEAAGWVSAFSSVLSVLFLAFQIRKNSEIAKSDFTFEMIEKLESFVIKNDSNSQCIHNVLKPEPEIGVCEGEDFYKKYLNLELVIFILFLTFLKNYL